jgi:acyl dehydratase
MRLRADTLTVGQQLPSQSFEIDRAMLVRYAGASGDFNTIHWNARVAHEVGLPDVIAHGMLTMALACRVVTDWAGDAGAIAEYQVRFTRPVVVPDPGSVALSVTAQVASLAPDGLVGVELSVKVEGKTVLAKARVTVRLG